MNTSGNKRFQETEKKIYNTFSELLSTKSFNDITVNDICKRAGISRPSFYSHYDDINDLIIQMEQEKGIHIQKILVSDRYLTVDSFKKYLDFIKNNRSFYTAYFSTSNNGIVTNQLMETFIRTHKLTNAENTSYQMNFFMSGLKSVAYKWLIDDCRISVQALAEIIYAQYQALVNLI